MTAAATTSPIDDVVDLEMAGHVQRPALLDGLRHQPLEQRLALVRRRRFQFLAEAEANCAFSSLMKAVALSSLRSSEHTPTERLASGT